MGTIHTLNSRRTSGDAPVVVSAHGFTCGEAFVAWQAVSEIRAWICDHVTADEAFLAFSVGERCLVVGATRAGFDALEAAMIAAFPPTATWRDAVTLSPGERNETVLFRRMPLRTA